MRQGELQVAKNLTLAVPTNADSGNWTAPSDKLTDELRALRSHALEELIPLENDSGAKSQIPQRGMSARVAQLLGDTPSVDHKPEFNAAQRMQELREQIVDIDCAIKIAIARSGIEHADRARDLAAQNDSAWRALQRRRALAIMEMMKASRQIEAMRQQTISGGMVPNLPLDGFTLKLGGAFSDACVTGHWYREFLKQAVTLGIITEKELSANV